MRRLTRCAVAIAAVALFNAQAQAQPTMDVLAYFQKAADAGRAGLARKTMLVDVRPAVPGEVVETFISGKRETVSPPAKAGDMVVRNRCQATGNELILVSADKFSARYEGPVGAAGADGWLTYRPRGVEMRYILVPATERPFSFTAPWGEQMIAEPGDAIVQDPDNPRDTYRIARDAFACTYEKLTPAKE